MSRKFLSFLSFLSVLLVTFVTFYSPAFALEGGVLHPNESLNSGECLYSNSGEYKFCSQTDGNLVLYVVSNGKSLWDSKTEESRGKTKGAPPLKTIMQGVDGNLVAYNVNNVGYWDSKTEGNPGAYLVMQDDGNLVIYASNGTSLWDTSTWGGVQSRNGGAKTNQPTISCDICTAVASKTLGLVAGDSCAVIASEFGGECDVVGGGPEDPFADGLCIALGFSVDDVCQQFGDAAEFLSDTSEASKELCEAIDLCS